MVRKLTYQTGLWLVGCILGCVLCGLVPAQAMELISGAVAGDGGLGSLSMGDADAMEWNPASLGEAKRTFQFIVTPVSTRITSDDWPIETVFRLLQGAYTPEERAALIANLKDGDLKSAFDLGGGAYISLGGNGLGATVRSHVVGSITADGATLLLLGGEPGKEYHLAGTQADGVVFGDVCISSVYSDPWLAKVLHITGFHMGGTLRYLHGLQYSRAWVEGSSVAVMQEGTTYQKMSDARFMTWQSQSGWGVATDVGLLLRLTPAVAVDVSMIDLGAMWWQDAQETTFEYEVDAATGTGAFVPTGTIMTDDRPRLDLPTRVRGGLSVTAHNGYIWSLQYSKPLRPEDGDTQWVVATQLNRFEALPLRLAAQYSNEAQKLTFAMGMGIRLGPLLFDIGTPNLTGLLSRGKDASISVTTGFQF